MNAYLDLLKYKTFLGEFLVSSEIVESMKRLLEFETLNDTKRREKIVDYTCMNFNSRNITFPFLWVLYLVSPSVLQHALNEKQLLKPK